MLKRRKELVLFVLFALTLTVVSSSLKQELSQLEKQIYELETSYLEVYLFFCCSWISVVTCILPFFVGNKGFWECIYWVEGIFRGRQSQS